VIQPMVMTTTIAIQIGTEILVTSHAARLA
jgi:hypothetical protein